MMLRGVVSTRELGRCEMLAVRGNVIFLRSLTSNDYYYHDVGCGMSFLTKRDKVPTFTGTSIYDPTEHPHYILADGTPTVTFIDRYGMSCGVKWSEELALSVVPTALCSVVKAILDGKDADLVEKAMVDYVPVKVKRFKSTGGYSFKYDSETITLQLALWLWLEMYQAQNYDTILEWFDDDFTSHEETSDT